MKKIIFIITVVFSTSAFSQVDKNTRNTTRSGLIAEIWTGNELRIADKPEFNDKKVVFISEPDSKPQGKTINITAKGYYYYDANKKTWLRLEHLPYNSSVISNNKDQH
ncbi:hypothetical protein [Epilithonimonas sp.]|uniref:hypothetical protein n=1 Tax=Epilithonimonas sp. TaxID=2894511 RepID=UPI0028A1499B|nr:hypothetical protein [Epilithonimonas sp.]